MYPPILTKGKRVEITDVGEARQGGQRGRRQRQRQKAEAKAENKAGL
jgi:hypothetical protein